MTRTVLLFPGQGSQQVGMGRDLAERFEAIDELWKRAEAVLGVPLRRIAWEGPLEELTRTENAQPALLLHGFSVFRLLSSRLAGSVVAAAGHSLGEFTAHLAAGTFDFEDALRLVRRRGELMAASGSRRPGTMAAVIGLEDADVRSVCASVQDGEVVPANFNAPGQVVVSGDEAAVERAVMVARERGARRVIPLQVSGAFHSPLMEEARQGLQEAIEATPMRSPRFPVVANAWARAVETEEEARRSLIEQLAAPVRWAESMEWLAELRPDGWLELGPGRVLAGLVRRIVPGAAALSVGTAAEVQALLED